jgi:hypothetical protein
VDRSSRQYFKDHPLQKKLRLRIVEKPRDQKPFQGKHFRIIAVSSNAELEAAKATIASLKDRVAYLERAMEAKQEKLLSSTPENKDDILGVNWKSNDAEQKRERERIAKIYRDELKKQNNPLSRATKKTSPQDRHVSHQGD